MLFAVRLPQIGGLEAPFDPLLSKLHFARLIFGHHSVNRSDLPVSGDELFGVTAGGLFRIWSHLRDALAESATVRCDLDAHKTTGSTIRVL